MTGIGLGGFLESSSDDGRVSGFGGNYIGNWKEKGEIIYWMHTMLRPVSTWSHLFHQLDEVDEKDKSGEKTGEKMLILRWPRFNSPDPKEVHANQYFRDRSTDRMKVPPQRDSFLILREFLRLMGTRKILPLNTPIFEWLNPKDNTVTRWNLGELSGLVKRGNSNFGHSIDTKFEGIFPVVVDGEIEKGVRTAREGKLLTDCIRMLIKDEIASNGEDEGDPTKNPYAIRCMYDKKANSPMQSYRAARHNKAEYTEKVYNAITSTEDLPDLQGMIAVGGDDDLKIRAAMESAAQIELPFDLLFGTLEQRRKVYDGDPEAVPSEHTRVSSSASPAAAAATPPAKPGGARPPSSQNAPSGVRPPAGVRAPAGVKAPATSAPATSAPATEVPKTSGRRRLMVPPAAPPVVMIPCDACGKPMDETAEKCPHCGATYEVTPDAEVPARQAPANVKPAHGVSGGEVRRPGASTKQAEPVREPGDDQVSGDEPNAAACFACGSVNIDANNACADCGQDQGDDIPF